MFLFKKRAGKLYLLYQTGLSIRLLRDTLLIAFAIIVTHITHAQNVAQVNQFPLQLSPSLAGSKENKRISAGINIMNTDLNRTNTVAVSYDQMIRKICMGGGIYYFQNSNNQIFSNDSLYDFFPGNNASKKYEEQQNSRTIGFCLAPKYNVYHKVIPKKIVYTFSPSVFVEIGNEQYKKNYNLYCIDYFSTVYSPANPNGVKHADSTTLYYDRYKLNNIIVRSGIGLLLNSENFILLSKISFSLTKMSEKVIHTNSYYNNTDFSSSLYIYAAEPTIHAGYTLRKHAKAAFSFTPIVGAGLKHYFNFTPSSVDSVSVYRYNISNADITQLNYIHASANFRFKYLLFGFAYTKYSKMIHKGITVGYQSNTVKIMLTGLINTGNVTYSNVEFTSGIFF